MLGWFALAALASAPETDACNQPALDRIAAAANQRWAELSLTSILRETHTLGGSELTYQGAVFHVGDRVTAQGSAGTFKEWVTGHPGEVRIAAQHGVVACFTRSTSGDIANELVVVKWDPQKWTEDPAGKTVALPAFDGLIHPSYLKADPKP